MIDIRCGDNLELMKDIKDNTIDLIYCDILYATGRKFKDYDDIKPIKEDVENHYLQRIKEMYRVLKPTGSIYLQMDTRINHWLRMILDDVFGYENFINEIVWIYHSQGKTNKYWNKKHDVILFYSKTKKYTFNFKDVRTYIQYNTYKRFKNEIDKTGYYTSFKNGKEYKYSATEGSLPKDFIDDIPYLNSENTQRVNYDTQKPIELIERIIKASSNENDLVADFYGGSFTTAHACKKLNRNFIGCDVNPNAVQIGIERINNC